MSMDRRGFLRRIGLGAVALAVGVKPLEEILAAPPVFEPVPLPFSRQELAALVHRIFAENIGPHVRAQSPLAALFAGRPTPVGGIALTFSADLRYR